MGPGMLLAIELVAPIPMLACALWRWCFRPSSVRPAATALPAQAGQHGTTCDKEYRPSCARSTGWGRHAVGGDMSVQRHLKGSQRAGQRPLLWNRQILDDRAQGGGEHLGARVQGRCALWCELKELLAPIQRRSLPVNQAAVNQTIDHALHCGRPHAAVAGNVCRDLLSIVKALQHAQLAQRKGNTGA